MSDGAAGDDRIFDFDYLIVGTGFGGSVSAMRLSEKGYRVGMLECGRRWEDEDFPESTWNLRDYTWMPKLGLRGILRFSLFKDIAVLSGCGVGGGSLVYSNVLYRPDEDFWKREAWQIDDIDWVAELEPHYREAERMLGIEPYQPECVADALMRQVADEMGVGDTFRPAPVGVFLGEAGKRVADPYFGGAGPARTGCTHCGACMVGCRVGAKNTLPKNYLYFAERLGTKIMPERLVTDVRPLGTSADGSEGWAVMSEFSGYGPKKRRTMTAKHVIISAGTLGTNKLLQRCRLNGSLPGISAQLGHRVRTNSESVLAVTAPDDRFDFSKAVSITSSFFPDETTHIEPVTFGANADPNSAMFTVLARIGPRRSQPARFLASLLRQPKDVLRGLSPLHWSRRTLLMIVMQKSDTSIRFSPRRNRDGSILLQSSVDEGYEAPGPIPAAHDVARRLAEKIGGTATATVFESASGVPMTAHILGGAVIGKDIEHGVIDANHQVHGFQGLMVCDGSVMPANLGVNPSLTISALTERAMSKIPPAPGATVRIGAPGALNLVAIAEAGALVSGVSDVESPKNNNGAAEKVNGNGRAKARNGNGAAKAAAGTKVATDS